MTVVSEAFPKLVRTAQGGWVAEMQLIKVHFHSNLKDYPSIFVFESQRCWDGLFGKFASRWKEQSSHWNSSWVSLRIFSQLDLQIFKVLGSGFESKAFWINFCKCMRGLVITSNSNLRELAWNFKQRRNSGCFLGGPKNPKQRMKVITIYM